MGDRDIQKADFEHWALKRGLAIWFDVKTGEYTFSKTALAWEAWQAGDRMARARVLQKQMDCVENCAGELQQK